MDMPATQCLKNTSRFLTVPPKLLCLALLSMAGTAPATAQSVTESDFVGIQSNFVDPATAHERQHQHNHYFLYGTDEPGEDPGRILDLQTTPYALAERPSGLDYDVYSGIGYGLATSMMMVGPRVDEAGYRRVVIIDTLEDYGSGQELARQYLELYNSRYFAAPGRHTLGAQRKAAHRRDHLHPQPHRSYGRCSRLSVHGRQRGLPVPKS